jgi:hypothetical protein
MRIVISIFCLPYEIDELEYTLTQLRKASYYIDQKNIEWVLDVTMSVSSTMVNWKKSSLPKSYFEDKLLKLSGQQDWGAKYFKTSEDINGCVSQRRASLLQHHDADYFIWLDTDIIFDERTLSYIQNTIQAVSQKTKYSVISPEIVKIWDNTWDCLVNEQFLDKPLNYHLTNDPYKDSGIKGEVSIEPVLSGLQGQPRFKFGGGFFTTISGELLRRVGVPQSFGHYGYEDTFVMWASEKLVQLKNEDIQQFKMKNLVVCENYKYRSNYHFLNNLSALDRREEYKKIAHSHFQEEIDKVE